jgi:glycine amidinotransferase/scyllo-inosamine-4-phosphate amidinotransferase 1
MIINSRNEWDKLREIVVGTATGANWPGCDPVFAAEKDTTAWKETPLPDGPVPQWIIDESNEDLNGLCNILQQAGVKVYRPNARDFVATGGMYNYCPRDRLLIAGDVVVDTAMHFPCRDQEIETLDFVTEGNRVVTMPRNSGYVLDAANVARLGDTWLYLESASGNRAAAVWLQAQFPEITIEICNFYAGVHIDSTVVPLREGLVLLNAARVNESNCPKVFEKWDKIYVDEVVPQSFYQYPYASKWIALNMLAIDSHTVVVDRHQTELIRKLEQWSFTVIPHELRHSRTLGGGFHCVTLDTWRENA